MNSESDSEIRCYRYNQEKDSGEPNGKYTLNTRYRKDAKKSIQLKKQQFVGGYNFTMELSPTCKINRCPEDDLGAESNPCWDLDGASVFKVMTAFGMSIYLFGVYYL